MGVVAYADNLLFFTPSRHAMQLMLRVCERYADRMNIKFSTDPDPVKPKSKVIHIIGKRIAVEKTFLTHSVW